MKGDYKVQDKSCSSVQRVEVSAVMHKVFPLWSGFMLNVLSFKGSEKLKCFPSQGCSKALSTLFPSVFSKRCSA